MPGAHRASLDAHTQPASEAEGERPVIGRDHMVVGVPHVRPAGVVPSVVKGRLAAEDEVHAAVQARRPADQHVPCVGVARGPLVAI